MNTHLAAQNHVVITEDRWSLPDTFSADSDTTSISSKQSEKGCKDRDKPEPPKVVILCSPWQRLGRFLIHVGPILAGLVMITINLQGYFIGTQFVGVTDAESQAISLLALQVTAKLFELAVITSLGFIILDVVHHFLLVDDLGLPLSLSGVRFTFTNLFNYALPSFWLGIGALRSPTVRIGVALLLVSCGIVATFIGPAAALLLIPANKNQWLANRLSLHAPIDDSQMWPTQLNQSHTGGNNCMVPSWQVMNLPSYTMTNCPWFASDIIGNTITTPWADVSGNLTVYDFNAYWARDVSRAVFNSKYVSNSTTQTSWAYSSMNFAGFLTLSLAQRWTNKINQTSWSLLSKYSRYAYRQTLGNHAETQGALAPMARAYCTTTLRDFNDMSPLPYPVIPLNGNYRLDTDTQYMIPTILVQQTSTIRSFWVPKPDPITVSSNLRSGANYTGQFPSAFLALQAPINNATDTAGLVATCSIDARWAKASTYCDYSGSVSLSGLPTAHTLLKETTLDTEGRPLNNGMTVPVDLDVSWLNVLTPEVSGMDNDASQSLTGLNSLSNLLNAENTPALFREDNVSSLAITVLEYLVPLLVVDGMARVGLWNATEPQGFLIDESSNDLTLFRTWLTAGLFISSSSTSTPLHAMIEWSITITGYAYSIDSTASIFAIVIVLAYMLLALGYMCFLIPRRWHSTTWSSIPEIIALSHSSPQSDLLKNTSGGIRTHSINQLLMTLRAPDVPLGDRETVHILFSKADEKRIIQRKARYHKIEQEKVYY